VLSRFSEALILHQMGIQGTLAQFEVVDNNTRFNSYLLAAFPAGKSVANLVKVTSELMGINKRAKRVIKPYTIFREEELYCGVGWDQSTQYSSNGIEPCSSPTLICISVLGSGFVPVTISITVRYSAHQSIVAYTLGPGTTVG